MRPLTRLSATKTTQEDDMNEMTRRQLLNKSKEELVDMLLKTTVEERRGRPVRTIEYDHEEWYGEIVELHRNGEVVETFYLDTMLQNYMHDSAVDFGIKYVEV
jgi:hypothetical protein